MISWKFGKHSDISDKSRYIPLDNISPGQAKFAVFNSNLSEYGVLGFEMGYSTQNPMSLVLWEAQVRSAVAHCYCGRLWVDGCAPRRAAASELACVCARGSAAEFGSWAREGGMPQRGRRVTAKYGGGASSSGTSATPRR